MSNANRIDELGKECWNRAFYAFATAEIFLQRSQKYTTRLRILSFLGLVFPLVIGILVFSVGLKNTPDLWVQIAELVAVPQVVVCLWSLCANWADDLQYSLESASDNLDLATRFKELAQQAANPPADFEQRVAALKSRDDARNTSDSKKRVDDKEKRRGHRAALRQFERSCTECGNVPTSMTPGNCKICGSF